MALDKILIGERIREIRVEYFNESREAFAKRCNLTTRCVGQVERKEFLFSISTLDKILQQQELIRIIFYMEKRIMIH